jgi:hypothetical protein
MSASATFFTSTQISSHEFVSFVLSQNGFISNEVNIDGGFSSGNSYVWFYGVKKTLNPKENEIEKSNMQLPMHVSSWVYFELSSAEGSNKLMTDIFQNMGQVWPAFMRCSLYRIFNHNTFADFFKNEGIKIVLSNQVSLFFSEDAEFLILNYLNKNIHKMSLMYNKGLGGSEPPLENSEVLKIININNIPVFVSVMYEYEDNDSVLTEALTKALRNAPRFFCEVHFGYGLNALAEKSLMFFLSDLLKKNNGVGMGIFESTVTPKDLNSPSMYSYIRFA